MRAEYEEGVHSRHFGCTDCHGGDAAVESLEAHSGEKGYIGTPPRTEIPKLCAGCHADPIRMKVFRLPTDQYAQYLTSEHGRRLLQGDTHVAVCTDCHGTHRIVAVEEPTSPVYPLNISTTCGACHSDRKLMSAYGLPGDEVEKFVRSRHGVALLEDLHRVAPTCATCHGAHGAVASDSLGAVCGQCHARTHEYFHQSPHAPISEAGQMAECIACHGDHDVQHPTHEFFETACQQCHATDSAAFAVGQKLQALLSRAEEELEVAANEMAETRKTFPTVVQLMPRLEQARAYYMEALPVQHSLAVDRVDDLTRSARSIGDEVRASVHAMQQQRQVHYVFLAAVWLFLLFTAAVAYLYKREIQQRRESASAPGTRANSPAGEDGPE